MAGAPDPKPPRRRHRNRAIRIIDPEAGRRVLARERQCAALYPDPFDARVLVRCPNVATNAHHVVSKGRPYYGDDVDENLLAVCGSGTTGCHGNFHMAAAGAREAFGAAIQLRPAIIAYVLGKLQPSPSAGEEFLRRRYGIRV